MGDTATWGHNQLARDLAKFIVSKGDRLVFENMPVGPAGSPRPDVYTLAKSYSPKPISYEVKVSYADFRSDVTAGKWQSYLPFSAAVIFAAPRGLIEKSDLPNGCGLIQRSDKGWRMLRGPRIENFSFTNDILMKILLGAVDNRRQYLTRTDWSGEEWCRRDAEARAQKGVGRRYSKAVAMAVANLQDVEKGISKARAHAAAIVKEADARDALITEEAENALREVGEILGLPPRIDIWSVRGHWKKRIEAMREDDGIKEARRSLEDMVAKFDEIRNGALFSEGLGDG